MSRSNDLPTNTRRVGIGKLVARKAVSSPSFLKKRTSGSSLRTLGVCIAVTLLLLHTLVLGRMIFLLSRPETTTTMMMLKTDSEWSSLPIPRGEVARTLIVYSGPDAKVNPDDDGSILRWTNFNYFLEKGITCAEDLIIVIGGQILQPVQETVRNQRKLCEERRATFSLKVVPREEHRCLDSESLRIGLEEKKKKEKNTGANYQYLIYLNEEVIGPKVTSWSQSWTQVLTSRLLNSEAKMVGLSVDYAMMDYSTHIWGPRIETSAFAVDSTGLEILQESGTIGFCQNGYGSSTHRPLNYGTHLANAVLKAGYGIYSLVHEETILSTGSGTQHKDIWKRRNMMDEFGEILSFDRVVFFKNKWFMPFSIAAEVGFVASLNHKFGGRVGVAEITRRVGGDTVMHVLEETRPTISVVISFCRQEILWMKEYFNDVKIYDVTVIAYCGKTPLWMPEGAHFEGPFELEQSPDYAMAYWIRNLQTKYNDQVWSEDHIIMFFRDSPLLSRGLPVEDMIRIGSTTGFACHRKPLCKRYCRSKFYPTMYSYAPMWRNFSLPISSSSKILPDGGNMIGDLIAYLDASVPTDAVPVCLGGSFVVKRSLLATQSLRTWEKLEGLLLRPPSTLVSYLVDRSWGALLSSPPSEDFGRIILSIPRTWIEIEQKQQYEWEYEMPGMLNFRSCRKFTRSCGQEQDKSFLTELA